MTSFRLSIFWALLFFTVPDLKSQSLTDFNQLYNGIADLKNQAGLGQVDSLWALSQPFFNVDADSTKGRINYIWGSYFYNTYNYDSARYYLEKSIDHFHSSGASMSQLGDAYYQLAGLHFDVEAISQAVEMYLSALKIYEEQAMPLSVAKTYNALANVYSYIAEYNLAISYYQQAIDLHKSRGDSSDVVMVLGNLASLHTTRKEYDLAMEYYSRGLRMLEGDSTSRNALDYMLGIGIVMEETKRLDDAKAYYLKSLRLAKHHQDYIQLGYVYQNLAYLMLAQNQLDSVPFYMNLVKQLAEKYDVKGLKANINEVMHEYYYKLGNYQLAYNTLKNAREQADSFYDIDMTRQLQAVLAQYNTLKKEKAVAQKDLELQKSMVELQQQATLRNILIGGIFVFLIIVLVVLRSQRLKTRANRLLLAKNQEIQDKNLQIKAAEEAKSRWFTNISHELRTPLTLIKGPVKAALGAIPGNDPVYKDLKIADRNISHLQGLVNEILDLSKMEDGQVKLQTSPTNLTELAIDVLASFDHAGRNKKVKLELDFEEEEVFMMVDREKIIKILNNLLSNALKFTGEGGKITVELKKAVENVSIRVKDTGEGISADDLDKIFNRFYQSSNPQHSRQGGTGVGLSLSREIALLHEGDLKVSSSIGVGSCFELILPVSLICEADQPDNAISDIVIVEAETPDSTSYSSVLKDKRILLVDDNADMREYITGFLKRNYEVVQARDGVEGLEKLSVNLPDLIISDIMMPRMDGMSFAREVKAHEKWKNIPFITVSAIADETEKINTLRIGIDDYLIKPFNAVELQVRAENLIRNYTERLSFQREQDDEEIPHEERTLKILEKEVYANLNNSAFNVLSLAQAAAMSERQLYRYIRQHTGLTPANFIKEIRLQKAMELLQKRVYNRTSQLSYAVGFQQPAYFSSVFKKRFGRLPNEYQELQ